ncbi:hypothetical protein SNN69_002917 [Cronobacter sakazakii]|nr:hypothetical protein [Cronobacter sakazakii]
MKSRKGKVTEVAVERDEYGCWTHPAFRAFCGEREYIPNEEFEAWLKENNLMCAFVYRDEFDLPFDIYCDTYGWEPEKPVGDGWFVGSIHDTEDGAVCIWLRQEGAA